MLHSVHGEQGLLTTVILLAYVFQAFSTARIEQTTARIEDASVQAVNSTLRVEQTLIVNNVESQVKLRRLEGMMARVLLETQFGQNVLNQTMEIIASVSTFDLLNIGKPQLA